MDTIEETKDERRRRLKREANARWYEANRDKVREAKAQWYATNPEGRERSAQWRAANPDKAKEAKAHWYATPEGREKSARWRSANREKIHEDEMRRRREDPLHRLADFTRSRINAALRAALAGKSGRSLDLLGCTASEYKLHLEALFEPGMTWENWAADGWHVDHTRPLASFDLSDPDQQREAFHFSNTRPAWAVENLSKGSLYEGIRHRHR